jgi:anti-anti-sigma factor
MYELQVFQTERLGDTLVVVPKFSVGGLAAEEVKPELRMLLAQLEDPELIHAVIDLEHVAYFGTSMLEVMHAVWRRLRDRGGKLVVCSVSGVGREVLRISRFDTLWEICDSRQKALAAVGRSERT